jgi:hypothetical protein
LVKLKKAKDKYPEVNCFVTTILFTVEVPERDYSYKSTEIVKYADLHRKAISKFSSPDLMMSAGLTNARELFEEYGDVMWLPLWSSDYHGMKVSSEILILHPHLDDPNFKSSMRMK